MEFWKGLYRCLSVIAIIATALLVWVNWDNIIDHFDKLINPEQTEEQVDDTQNDDAVLEQNGITMIELD